MGEAGARVGGQGATAEALASAVAARLGALPGVVAVALGGSRAGTLAAAESDLDLYVYADPTPPPADRLAVVAALGGVDAEIDNRYWETGDEWADPVTGLGLDVMYRAPSWIEGELDRVLVRHEASVGYSTALWHSIRVSEALVDPHGWYGRLRGRADVPYPEPMRRAIVAKNLPLLGRARSSYRRQIALAVERDDWVAVNHRVAALLASVFDVLFALNRATHPGEKRLLAHVERECPLRPPRFFTAVTAILAATGSTTLCATELVDEIDLLVHDVEELVTADGSLALD